MANIDTSFRSGVSASQSQTHEEDFEGPSTNTKVENIALLSVTGEEIMRRPGERTGRQAFTENTNMVLLVGMCTVDLGSAPHDPLGSV